MNLVGKECGHKEIENKVVRYCAADAFPKQFEYKRLLPDQIANFFYLKHHLYDKHLLLLIST